MTFGGALVIAWCALRSQVPTVREAWVDAASTNLTNLMHGRVDTICLGVALSGAADLLAAGRKRQIVPGAVAMIHQVSWDMGTEFTANLVKNARFLERLNDFMAELLARDTGRPKEQLINDMATDHYLFGQEIIDYGLADGFYEPPPPRRRPRRGRRIPETFERPARVKEVE